jgi:3-polyprenyl-4-hydroxybenzoate decarboxylase
LQPSNKQEFIVSKISAPRSNREFIEACVKAGDAVRIKQEVDWENEAGAIVRRACELGAAAPFMEKIKDYPGFSYFGAPLSTYRRMAISLGMDPASSLPEIGKEYLQAHQQRADRAGGDRPQGRALQGKHPDGRRRRPVQAAGAAGA